MDIKKFSALLGLCVAGTSSSLYAQEAFDCKAKPEQVIIYCNDFETRSGGYTASPYYNDFSNTPVFDAYYGTETKDPRITLNGTTQPAFIGQNYGLESFWLNNDYYKTSDTNNNYSVSFVNMTNPTLADMGPDGEGYEALAFSFDAKNPVTGQIAPFIELQLDFAPTFISNISTGRLPLAYQLWTEPPRMTIGLYDGQLTTDRIANPNPVFNDALLNNNPAALDSFTISGGTPPATTVLTDYPINFKRSLIRLDTTNVTDSNGTITVLMDVLKDRSGSSSKYNYATFDNLKVNILLTDRVVEKSISRQSGSDDSVAEAGETITYDIKITNPSRTTALTNVNIKDSLLLNLPTGVTLLGTPTIDVGSINENAVGDYTVPNIAPDTTVTITYLVTLPGQGSDFANIGNSLINLATADGSTPPTTCPTNSAACPTLPTKAYPLVTKTLSNQSGSDNNVAEAKEILTYKIAVKNPSSTQTLTNINIKDSLLLNLPAGVVISSNPSLNSGTLTTNARGNYVISSIAPNTTATITYAITLPDIGTNYYNLGASLVNTISTDGSTPPGSCDSNDSSCSGLPTKAYPTFTKSLSGQSGSDDSVAEPGEVLTYQIAVRNPHPSSALTNVNVKDSLLLNLPSGVTISTQPSVSPGSLSTTATGNYTINSIAADSTATITYAVTLPASGSNYNNLGDSLVNTATIDGSTPPKSCPDGSSECSGLSTEAHPIISKRISKQSGDNNNVAEAGEVITYEITVKNSHSTQALSNVNIKDSLLLNLPNGVTLNSGPTINAGTLTTNAIGDYTIPSIAGNATVKITYAIKLPGHGSDYDNLGDSLANAVTGDGSTPGACDPSASECVTLTTNADPSTSKTLLSESIDNDLIAEAGETLTYQITVNNSANTHAAVDINLKDSLLANLPTGMTVTAPAISSGTGTLTFTGTKGSYILDNVGGGATTNITYSVKFPTGANYTALGSSIANVITDDGSTPATTCAGTPAETDCVLVDSNPKTTISTEITNESAGILGIAQPAEEITYKIFITNNSATQEAVNINVRDSLLANLPDGASVNTPVLSTGTLTKNADGNYTIESIASDAMVDITYIVTMPAAGTDYDALDVISNAVSNDGSVPTCSDTDVTNKLCTRIVSEGHPTTTKTLTNESIAVDGVAESGEVLSYAIKIENRDSNPIPSVTIKDSLLANLPDGVSASTVTADPASTSVSNPNPGEYLISSTMNGGDIITLTYTITLPVNDAQRSDDDYDKLTSLSNAVTDTGETPQPCTVASPDCVLTSKNVDPTTSKAVTDESIMFDKIFEQGEIITYTITVDNTAHDTDAVNINIQDSLLQSAPANVSVADFADFVVSEGNLVENSAGNYTLDKVKAGTATTISYTITIPNAPEFDDLANLISNHVTDNGIAPNSSCTPNDSDCAGIVKSGEVTISKAVSSESISTNHVAEEGEEIFYEIKLTNAGDTPAATIHIRDSLLAALPNGLNYTEPYTMDGTLTKTADGDYELDVVDANSTATISYTVLMPTGADYKALTQVVNAVTADGSEPVACTTESTTCVILPTNVDPLTTKALTGESIAANEIAEVSEVLTYTITVNNTANSTKAVNINIKDSLLANLPKGVVLSSQPQASTGTLTKNNDGDYTLDEVAANDSVAISYSITLPGSGADYEALDDKLANVITDDGSTPGACAEGDSSCVNLTVNGDPETSKALTAESINLNHVAEVGETLTYVITINNSANNNAAVNLNIQDSLLQDLPQGVTLSEGPTIAPSTIQLTTNSAGNYTLDSVAAGATATLTYKLTLPELGDDYDNLADSLVNAVTDDRTTPVPSCAANDNNCISLTTNADPTTSKALTNESIANDQIVEPGEVLTYVITIDNNANDNPAVNLNIQDSLLQNLPDGVTLSEGPTVNPSSIALSKKADGNYFLDSVPENSTATITYKLTMPALGPDYYNLGSSLANAVTDNGTTPPTGCDSNSNDCISTETKPYPVLTKRLAAQSGYDDEAAEAGEVLTYEIIVANPYTTSDLNNVQVKDSLLMNLPVGVVLSSPPTLDNGNLTTIADGEFSIDSIVAETIATITYSLTLPEEGDDYNNLGNTFANTATVDGSTPPTTCETNSDECSGVHVKHYPEVSIVLVSQSGDDDELAEPGETLNYEINVSNINLLETLNNLRIKNSLLLNMPAGATLSSPPTIKSNALRSLTLRALTELDAGDFLIDFLSPSANVTIAYAITLPETGSDYRALGEAVISSVTKDGSTPPSNCVNNSTICVRLPTIAQNPGNMERIPVANIGGLIGLGLVLMLISLGRRRVKQ